MDYCVFIHTNHKQIVGALVAEYALRRNSKNNERFDVKIIRHNDYPFFNAYEGQLYLRDGVKRPWFNDDLQSFTPLRLMPPELLGRYKPHPDLNQERFFFGLLKECLEKNIVTEDMIRGQMAQNHVRHDAFEVIDRTPKLAGAWR